MAFFEPAAFFELVAFLGLAAFLGAVVFFAAEDLFALAAFGFAAAGFLRAGAAFFATAGFFAVTFALAAINRPPYLLSVFPPYGISLACTAFGGIDPAHEMHNRGCRTNYCTKKLDMGWIDACAGSGTGIFSQYRRPITVDKSLW
jgi:hypothetical protein